ncbi:MAG: MarR family transcriptional regulator [Methanobrevibacter sp.]|jgi:DNA-binding MarR family transcriptional regulator|nr:MarR family transcriptional regulator [Methanobrevibacter sp.]
MDEKKKKLASQFMELAHIYRHLARHHRHHHKIKGIDPYKGQGRVISLLKIQPEIMQKELGYLLDISTQALAEILNKLEKKGYITREQSKKDRRSFVIKLTDSGREAVPEENYKRNYNYIEESFDCLDDEEQENLINYLDKIIENIENEIDGNEFIKFFRERFFAKHKNMHNLFRDF